MKVKYISTRLTIAVCALLSTGISVCAQSEAADSLRLDSIANAFDKKVELHEVVVKGASMIKKADRQLYIPSADQMKVATNGVDLLSKLNIPTLVVNPMASTIALASQGKLDIRINGRPIDVKELKNIDPKYVVRVEYHDNPSLRYGGAEAVVDFIIKQPTSGGSLGLDMKQAVNQGWGEYNINAKINHKKSEFSYDSYIGPRWDFGQWRSNIESYTRKDGSKYQRIETGIPTNINYIGSWNQLGYNFTDPGKQLFSAQLKMWYENNKNDDFRGILENQDSGIKYQVNELSKGKFKNPALDLYYQRNLAKDQLIMFNIVGAIAPSNSYRNYTEYLVGNDGDIATNPTTDITTSLDGKTYSLIGEADYEKTWKNGRFTAGGRHTQSWSENTYKILDVKDKMRLAETYGYAEYWRRLGNKVDITLGVGASHYYNNNVDVKKSSEWVFRPKLNVRYVISNSSTLRFDFNSYGNAPSLSQITSVEQAIDKTQVSVGNANLNTFTSYKFGLQYEFNKNWFYGRFRGEYQYHNKPIMEDKYWGENNIISSYANHRDAQIQKYSFTFRIQAIKDWLSFSGNLGFNRYIMHGNDYTHCYNNTYFNGQMELTHWNFTLFSMIMTNYNNFWGESINGGENLTLIALAYKHKDWNFFGGMMNPFTNNYKRESSNWNKYAGYERATHIKGIQQLVAFGFSWNIQWGRKHNADQKRLNNESSRESVKASGKG